MSKKPQSCQLKSQNEILDQLAEMMWYEMTEWIPENTMQWYKMMKQVWRQKKKSDAAPRKHVEIKIEMNFCFRGFSFRN